MQIIRILFIYLCINLYSVYRASAQDTNDFIFKISWGGINSGSTPKETGFKLRGKSCGIITCLHGLIGGRSFVALGEHRIYKNLSITRVDVDNDLALLQSPELIKDEEGLDQNLVFPLSGRRMRVLGYPESVSDLTEKTVSIGVPNVKKLEQIIPVKYAATFARRNSPSPSIRIIYVEGQMVAGHSGAPLMDRNNMVYGVIFGGIDNGAAGISWAVPISEIKWHPISLMSRKLRELATQQTSDLYSSGETATPNSNEINMSGVWALHQDNSRTLHSDGTLDNTHWSIGALLNLVQNDNLTITGKYSDRSAIHFRRGDVTGTINSTQLKLTIICTEGSCIGSGFVVTCKIVNGTLIPQITPLENRPPACILYIPQQVSLVRN